MIIISAMTKERLIGKGLHLPWRIPEELKHFKTLTQGNVCIMGLSTYQGIGRLLPDRHFVILSKDPMMIPGAVVATSIPKAIEKAKEFKKDIFICGGKSVYEQFLPIVDTMFISYIKGEYDGDVYFPEWDMAEWEEMHREDKGSFLFCVYKRIQH